MKEKLYRHSRKSREGESVWPAAEFVCDERGGGGWDTEKSLISHRVE